MNKKLVYGIIGLVVVIGALAIYRAKMGSSGEVVTAVEGSPESDRATLENPAADEQKVYEAFHRLARAGDPAARSAGLEKALAESRTVREGAANALGYFADDEAFKALVALLDDNEPNVRIRTLQALGNTAEPRRVEAILKFLERPELTDREKTIAHSVLIKLGKTAEDRKASIEYLVGFAMKGDDLEHYIAFSKLTELVPDDENVLKLIRFKIWNTKNNELIATGVRHLGAVKDPWLKDKLEKFVRSEDEQVRAAAVLTLHQYCAGERWKWLKELAQVEKSRMVLESVLREASVLGGSAGKSLIEDMLSSGRLDEAGKSEAERVLSGHLPPADICQ